MVFASRSRVNDEPGSAARHPRRRDIADHKRLLSMLGNKSPTRTRLYGSTTPRQTPLGNRRSETGIHRSGVLECPCSREFWNRQSVWLSSAWEVPPLMRRNVRTAQFTRAQVICRRGMRSEAHWLPEINPKCWICVTDRFIDTPLSPVLANESRRTGDSTKCAIHDPASRSGPAAEAASVCRSEQVSRLSRAW